MKKFTIDKKKIKRKLEKIKRKYKINKSEISDPLGWSRQN